MSETPTCNLHAGPYAKVDGVCPRCAELSRQPRRDPPPDLSDVLTDEALGEIECCEDFGAIRAGMIRLVTPWLLQRDAARDRQSQALADETLQLKIQLAARDRQIADMQKALDAAQIVECGALQCPFEVRAKGAEARYDRLAAACDAFDQWLNDRLQSMAKAGRMEALADARQTFKSLRAALRPERGADIVKAPTSRPLPCSCSETTWSSRCPVHGMTPREQALDPGFTAIAFDPPRSTTHYEVKAQVVECDWPSTDGRYHDCVICGKPFGCCDHTVDQQRPGAPERGETP